MAKIVPARVITECRQCPAYDSGMGRCMRLHLRPVPYPDTILADCPLADAKEDNGWVPAKA